MIVVQFPVNLQAEVLKIVGEVEAKDVSVTVKVRGDVGEAIIEKLEKIGVVVIKPVKS